MVSSRRFFMTTLPLMRTVSTSAPSDRIDQVGIFVVQRRQVGFVHVDDADIRLLSRLRECRTSASSPRTFAPSQVAIRRTVRADMTVGSRRATFASLAAVSISWNMSRLLLLAQPSVPRPTTIPCFEHGGDGGDAGGQLHVALRVVDHLAAVIGKHPHILLVHHDAVKGDEALVEQADFLRNCSRPLAEFFLQLFRFRLVFQKMRRQRDLDNRSARALDAFRRSGEQV